MNLEAYLERIRYRGALGPTLETLREIHRSHLLAISYENLDIHLGRKLVLDPEAIYRKIVLGGRGGWCYEMNTLLGWALREVGFAVRYLAGAVGREVKGAAAEGNHLVLLVELDCPYIADVGFGDGFLEPLPLEPGRYPQGFLEFGLERRDERWYVQNHRWGGATGFDFTLSERQLADFEAKCHELQTSPDSGFVKRTVCQRFGLEGIRTLRGAVFRRVTEAGVAERVVESLEDYRAVLDTEFDLRLDGIEDLWRAVWERHQQWIKETVG